MFALMVVFPECVAKGTSFWRHVDLGPYVFVKVFAVFTSPWPFGWVPVCAAVGLCEGGVAGVTTAVCCAPVSGVGGVLDFEEMSVNFMEEVEGG